MLNDINSSQNSKGITQEAIEKCTHLIGQAIVKNDLINIQKMVTETFQISTLLEALSYHHREPESRRPMGNAHTLLNSRKVTESK